MYDHKLKEHRLKITPRPHGRGQNDYSTLKINQKLEFLNEILCIKFTDLRNKDSSLTHFLHEEEYQQHHSSLEHCH